MQLTLSYYVPVSKLSWLGWLCSHVFQWCRPIYDLASISLITPASSDNVHHKAELRCPPLILSGRKSCTRICLKVISPAARLGISVSTIRASISQYDVSSVLIHFFSRLCITSWWSIANQFHSSNTRSDRVWCHLLAITNCLDTESS